MLIGLFVFLINDGNHVISAVCSTQLFIVDKFFWVRNRRMFEPVNANWLTTRVNYCLLMFVLVT